MREDRGHRQPALPQGSLLRLLRFSPSYKLRIVEEADRCTEPGEVGRLLRQEGLYSSHLTTWRKAARSGSLKALSKKRGRKPERNPLLAQDRHSDGGQQAAHPLMGLGDLPGNGRT